MILVIPRPVHTTPEEKRLIEKARKALATINRRFKTTISGIPWELHAEGVVWDRPLRLDFQATDGKPGQAFVGPQLNLTEDLFDGDSLKPEVIREFEAACAHFELHLESNK